MQFDSAKAAYRRVLDRDPKHAKVLQQLGWLHHQQSTSFANQEQAIEYLEKSVSSGMLNPGVPSYHTGSADHMYRSKRRTELVPPRPLLHGTAEVPESVRSVPAGCLP